MKNEDVFLTTLYDKRRELRDRLNAIDKTIVEFGGSIEDRKAEDMEDRRGKVQVANHADDIPSDYNGNLTWEQKTLFGLSKCANQTGFVTDIINALNKYDKDISVDDDKAFRAITTKSSILGRKHVINRKAVGNKYKYSIK